MDINIGENAPTDALDVRSFWARAKSVNIVWEELMLFPKRKRRCWWEFDETTKQYVEGMHQKFRSLPANLQPQILRLPRSFTCFHFNKKVPIEDRLRFTLTEVRGRRKGALEYIMLEIDRVILRKAK